MSQPIESAKKQIIQKYFATSMLPLTKREIEIARLAAEGLTNQEIGKKLFISSNTVKMALKSIYSKLKVNRRVLLKQFFE